MKYFMSPKMKGFFIEGVNSEIPEDALEISPLEVDKLILAECSGEFLIEWGSGHPKLIKATKKQE
ncbi:hypothetical protein NNW46_003140 [Escherichia coli]|nr:hypothetical protein [Escherichia coli]